MRLTKKKYIIYVQKYSFDNWQNVATYFEKNKIYINFISSGVNSVLNWPN